MPKPDKVPLLPDAKRTTKVFPAADVDAVRSGVKRQTIRRRFRPTDKPRPGDIIVAATWSGTPKGQRPTRKQLGEFVLQEVEDIAFIPTALRVGAETIRDRDRLDRFAQDEGHDNWESFLHHHARTYSLKIRQGEPAYATLFRW